MCATANALRQADKLYAGLKPHLAEMIDRNDPSVAGLTFSDIEANSAAAGDLLARLMMLRALAEQPPATDEEARELKELAKSAASAEAPEQALTLLAKGQVKLAELIRHTAAVMWVQASVVGEGQSRSVERRGVQQQVDA